MSAADYYQGGDAPPQNNGAPQQQQQQPLDGEQAKYTQPPPQYGYGPQVPEGGWSEKPTFEQAFKLEKPKFNDVWAAIFVRASALGFPAAALFTAGHCDTC